MIDPITTLRPTTPDAATQPWARRLLLFLRIVAGLMMLKGLYHWLAVLGVSTRATFESEPTAWQAATVFFAVIDLVAAVGLWMAAAWGGVVWLTGAILMIAVELFFPEVYGGQIVVVLIEFAIIAGYLGLALMAGRERDG